MGPKALTVEQIQQRIASRYPQAQPIPGRPLLDELLRKAGIDLDWEDEAFDGQGAYHHRSIPPELSPTTSTLPRVGTSSQAGLPLSPEADAAYALEERLNRVIQEHHFLILTVAPRYFLRAEEEACDAFP